MFAKSLRPKKQRKQAPEIQSKKIPLLHMTHGDALGLNNGEVLRLIFNPTRSSSSRSSDANKLNNKNNLTLPDKIKLPDINEKKVKFCVCEEPLLQTPMPFDVDDNHDSDNEQTVTLICMRCGGIIERNVEHMRKLGARRSSSCLESVSDFKKKLKKNHKNKFTSKLPVIVDQDRYKNAYLRALHVAKFGSNPLPSHWPEFFDQEITRSFIFSYVSHTPNCLRNPTHCIHKKNQPKRTESELQIRKHIFRDVNVNDYLDPPINTCTRDREFDYDYDYDDEDED